MSGRGASRRVVFCTLLLALLAVSAIGWTELAPAAGSTDRTGIALTAPPALGIDAPLTARVDTPAGTDQKLLKARPRLGAAVVPETESLPAAAVEALAAAPVRPASTLCCRWAVSLRAPPGLLLP